MDFFCNNHWTPPIQLSTFWVGWSNSEWLLLSMVPNYLWWVQWKEEFQSCFWVSLALNSPGSKRKAFFLLTYHQSSLIEGNPLERWPLGSFFYNIRLFQVHALILGRSPADVFVPLNYSCWSSSLIKLSLKIIVYIIDPTSKSKHVTNLITKSFRVTAGVDGVLHLGCSFLNHAEVSTSGNESELAVESADPCIKPRIGTEKALICLGWEILKMDKFLIFAFKKIGGY